MSYNILDVAKDIVSGDLDVAPETIVKERLAICNDCEVQNKLLHICTACGCFLPAKTKLSKSSCPMELWGEAVVSQK